MGTLSSWNPPGHSRPVTGLLYLFLPNLRSAVPRFVLIQLAKTTYPCSIHFEGMLASLTNIRSVASVKNDHPVTLQSVVMQFAWVVKIKFAKLYTDGQTVMWQLLHDRP